MRTGIATVSLSGLLADKLPAIAAAGFDGIEVFDNDLVASPLAPREVAARCADLGLAIDLFQPVRDVEGVAPERFGEVLHRVRTKLGVMAELGATTFLACSNVSPAAVRDPDLSAEQLHEVGTLAAEHGVTVAYEALAWGRHVSRLDDAWDIVQRADHPAVGLAVDTFHVLARGDDASALAGIPGDRIAFLQVADAPLLDMSVLEWSRHHRCFPGQGMLDVEGVVAAVLEAGYRGPVSLEVFSDVVRETDPRRTAEAAMRSLLFLEDQLARRRGETTAAAPPTSTDAAFLELSSPPGDSSVPDLLARTGLRARWKSPQQAGRVVAQRRRARRGQPDGGSVSADGDRSRVPGRLRRGRPGEGPALAGGGLDARARRGSPARHHRPVGAARVRQRRAGRTRRTGRATSRPTDGDDDGHLTGIDHVGVALSRDVLDDEVGFFRTVFDLAPGAIEEFFEPHGRLRSRALRPARGDLRVVLNVEETGPLETSRTGVTQVAFGCDDVFAVVRSLRSRGVALMAVPDNYYVDLEARFGLAPELLDDLKAHHLLYDRIGDGELLHAYTDVLPTGFYVEVLERRGGYDGYGSANTHVRLAAQR